MANESVKDILCSIIAQAKGFNADVDVHGVYLSELIEMIEYLTNQTSKLKFVVLDMPKKGTKVN